MKRIRKTKTTELRLTYVPVELHQALGPEPNKGAIEALAFYAEVKTLLRDYYKLTLVTPKGPYDAGSRIEVRGTGQRTKGRLKLSPKEKAFQADNELGRVETLKARVVAKIREICLANPELRGDYNPEFRELLSAYQLQKSTVREWCLDAGIDLRQNAGGLWKSRWG